MARATLSQIRHAIQPGDVFAFGGYRPVSLLTKGLTQSNVSHVGVALRSSSCARSDSLIVDARGEGVVVRGCREVVQTYEGEVWWLRLHPRVRRRLNYVTFSEFLRRSTGAEFAAIQALFALLEGNPLFGRRFGEARVRLANAIHVDRTSSLRKFYCAKLVASALLQGGVVSGIDVTNVTPIELCRWALYRSDCVQLRGRPSEIDGFNTIDVSMV